MKFIKYLLPAILITLPGGFHAFGNSETESPIIQDNTVKSKVLSGQVTDENGEPMPGVAVYESSNLKGGVMTDSEGRFSIKVAGDCPSLTVSCMGYLTEDVPVNKIAKIKLTPDAQSIQETVVTGIFTRKKDSFTGAVQSITSDDLKRVGNSNVIESLKNLDPSLLV